MATAAREAAGCIGSMGVAMTPCSLPGAAPSTRLEGNMIEVGMGIHGEPGAHTCEAKTADELVEVMLASILDKPGYLKVASAGEVTALPRSLHSPPSRLLLCAPGLFASLSCA